MSISTVDSADLAAAGVETGEVGEGGFGLRGIFGRHGDRHRAVIQQLLPFLKDHLKKPGMLSQSDKANVKAAVDLALSSGVEPCWGPNKVYRSRRNCEGAILNIYFTSVVASLHES